MDIAPSQTYRLSYEARGNAKNAHLDVAICEKWLIYPGACVQTALGAGPGIGDWLRVEKSFNSGVFGTSYWFGHRPGHLSLSVFWAGTFVDIDNIALIDSAGRNLIRNGEFSTGPQFWFFSSDRHHLPWHAKNMFLHVYFEQGGFGLVLFAVLYLLRAPRVCAPRATRRRARHGSSRRTGRTRDRGVFDSLLDIPRVTTLAFFFMALSLFPAPGSDRAAQAPAPSTGPSRRERSGPRGSSRRGSTAQRK